MERELPVDKLAILTKIQTDASVAQLDRASVFGTEGWGFESLRVYSPIYSDRETTLFTVFW